MLIDVPYAQFDDLFLAGSIDELFRHLVQAGGSLLILLRYDQLLLKPDGKAGRYKCGNQKERHECHIVGIHDGKGMYRHRKKVIEYQHAGDCAKDSIFIPPGTGADQKDAHHEYHKDVLLGHSKSIQDQSQYAGCYHDRRRLCHICYFFIF